MQTCNVETHTEANTCMQNTKCMHKHRFPSHASRHHPIPDQTPLLPVCICVCLEFNPISMESHGLTDTQGWNPCKSQQPLYPNAPVQTWMAHSLSSQLSAPHISRGPLIRCKQTEGLLKNAAVSWGVRVSGGKWGRKWLRVAKVVYAKTDLSQKGENCMYLYSYREYLEVSASPVSSPSKLCHTKVLFN